MQNNSESPEETNRTRTIIDNIGEGIITVDFSGKIQLANTAAYSILRRQPGDLVGSHFSEALPLIDGIGNRIKFQDSPIQKALDDKVAPELSALLLRSDGSSLPIELIAKPVGLSGETKGAVATFRDVTQARAVDRAKTEFVTLASHQLRTPISAIGWFSELLLHGDAGKLTTEQLDYIQKIYHSNQRMAALVDSMLMASSLELGNLPLRPEDIDLPQLCRKVLQSCLRTLTADKILHIKENYDPKLPLLKHDEGLVKTIIQNLVSNSFKYTPSNGNVAVSVSTISSGPNEQMVRIDITDSGLGIPKDEQSKIFERLFRASNARRQDTDGTGLGLYIVKTAAEYVGGSISYVSEENKGSTFSVVLPIESPRKSIKELGG